MFFGRRELRFRPSGKHLEIFALSFDIGHKARLQAMLTKGIRLLEAGLVNDGKLRMFYEMWSGLPIGSFEHNNMFFYGIEDWTEDIDELTDYLIFKDEVVLPSMGDMKFEAIF